MNISVLGAGSWGMTLAIHLYKNNHNVTVWEFDNAQVELLKKERENKIFLPGIKLPDDLRIENDIKSSISGAEMIIFAVPSQVVRMTAEKVNRAVENWKDIKAVVSVAKGLELETHKTMSTVLAEELNQGSNDLICVLSGPSHAEEVSRDIPTAIVAASTSNSTSELVQETFSSSYLRVYAGDDVEGLEYGGSFKNTIAIAAGIVDGAGFGDNTKAALMTRALVEISRLGVAMGAKEETFRGLAGMGDMIVTCLSRHSRNRHVGEEVGKGKPLEEVLESMSMVAEGVNTTKIIRELSLEYNIEMPISEQVYKVLFENKSPEKAVRDLMTRDLKSELPNS
ncbi:MAG: NAD(P)H-dependent glycerol-3-phosphate dehydrogenase [Candidatus Marinimicrobia bacterium]|nr:NAD(P)H-dependent glycerol-3-phosphate dehydrogenase [Candidatus Neomarinimicrobiota bacterium]